MLKSNVALHVLWSEVNGQKAMLQAYRAVRSNHEFYVGWCLGGETLSDIGRMVLDRLLMESPDTLEVRVVINDRASAWNTVHRHLQTFTGRVLLFVCSDSRVYDAACGTRIYCAEDIAVWIDGKQKRLTETERQRIKFIADAMYDQAGSS